MNISEHMLPQESYIVIKSNEKPIIKENYLPEPEKQVELKYTDAGAAPFEYVADIDKIFKWIEK